MFDLLGQRKIQGTGVDLRGFSSGLCVFASDLEIPFIPSVKIQRLHFNGISSHCLLLTVFLRDSC